MLSLAPDMRYCFWLRLVLLVHDAHSNNLQYATFRLEYWCWLHLLILPCGILQLAVYVILD